MIACSGIGIGTGLSRGQSFWLPEGQHLIYTTTNNH